MKRWALGSIAFFFAFGIGTAVAWFFLFDRMKPELVLDETPRNDFIAAEPNTKRDDFIPELTDVEIDELPFKVSMNMELVRNGNVDLCTTNPRDEDKKWLGLFKRGNEFSLERRTIDFGPVVSTDFGSFSSMRFNDASSAILLLTDQSTLEPGLVKTLYLKPALNDDGMNLYVDGMTIGDRREFTLGKATYGLRIAPATLKGSHRASVMILENGTESQTIWFKTLLAPDEIGELEWVGDMDGDNRLDLQFSSYAQNGGQLESFFFLSSYAKPGQLIGFAAFYTARCRAFKVAEN